MDELSSLQLLLQQATEANKHTLYIQHPLLLTLASLQSDVLTQFLHNLASNAGVEHSPTMQVHTVVMDIPSLIGNRDNNSKGLTNQDILIGGNRHIQFPLVLSISCNGGGLITHKLWTGPLLT